MLVVCVHINGKKPFGSLYKQPLGGLSLSFPASDGAWTWLRVCLSVAAALWLFLPWTLPLPSVFEDPHTGPCAKQTSQGGGGGVGGASHSTSV